jgi:NAD-dependent dihydropyrimidine dehydrogenase PreA subunit
MRGRKKAVRSDLGLTPVDDRSVEEGNLSRRNMLLTLGVAGVAAAGGALGLISYRDEAQAAAALADPAFEHQWCRVVDLRKCTGERKCVSSCQTRHGLPPDQTWMRVLSWQDDVGKEFFMPVPCQMCENAPCLDVCPVSATFHNPQGVVLVDQDTCIGSRACMAACPGQQRQAASVPRVTHTP